MNARDHGQADFPAHGQKQPCLCAKDYARSLKAPGFHQYFGTISYSNMGIHHPEWNRWSYHYRSVRIFGAEILWKFIKVAGQMPERYTQRYYCAHEWAQ